MIWVVCIVLILLCCICYCNRKRKERRRAGEAIVQRNLEAAARNVQVDGDALTDEKLALMAM